MSIWTGSNSLDSQVWRVHVLHVEYYVIILLFFGVCCLKVPLPQRDNRCTIESLNEVTSWPLKFLPADPYNIRVSRSKASDEPERRSLDVTN